MSEQRMNETFLRGAVGPRVNVVRGETGDVPIYLTLPGTDNGEVNQPEIFWGDDFPPERIPAPTINNRKPLRSPIAAQISFSQWLHVWWRATIQRLRHG